MSSRVYSKLSITSIPPADAKLGDTYFDPTQNILYELLPINGNAVGWTQISLGTTASNAVIPYGNRGILRSTVPSSSLTNTTSPSNVGSATIIVDGLGVFVYYATGQNELDDDETCFIVNGGPGAWVLLTPHPDLQQSWTLIDNEMIALQIGTF
jgi:hypothetical protein